MKRYLDLVPIAARVHRKQNRMSFFCIILAVFLVTAIFGMADMFIRSQIRDAQAENGNWHIGLRNISDEDAALLAARPDVAAFSSYGVFNYGGELGYTLDGTNVAICGSDESLVTEIFSGMLIEGHFPQTDQEALLTKNARDMLELNIGDQITIHTPGGSDLMFTVAGFLENTARLMSSDFYGVCLAKEGFRAIYPGTSTEMPEDYNTVYYVQFAHTGNIQSHIADLKATYALSDDQIIENTKLLGLLGQSTSSFMMQIYTAAAVLFVLVLFAGIMMIASSLNSNVAQRTEFFGLLRCIGATPKQVMRLVHREALGWCRFAIPAGLLGGIVIVWVLCYILRCLSPKFFRKMPVFGISLPGVAAGIVVGLLTVHLAARSPAKKASGVSPLAAVTGHAVSLQPVRRSARTGLFKIDTALGIHHATSSRKNFILMVASFALSIILFLGFSVTIGFMNHTLTPLYPWTADISLVSPDKTCALDSAVIDGLKDNPAVASVYGRMTTYDVPVTVNGSAQRADLISYDPKLFDWSESYLQEGSMEAVRSETGTALVVYEPQNTIKTGDTVTVTVNGRTTDIKIVGILSASPYNNAADVGTMICSESTFRQLTGINSYGVIDMQLNADATDADVNAIHRSYADNCTFVDKRMDNSSTRGVYYSVWLFLYGFLVLIALITIFNVINSIAMSVAARTKQYGAFRAIGLSSRQLAKMVTAEALVYGIVGSTVGTVLGLICNRMLFRMLITYQWGDPWRVPWAELGIILLIVVISVVLAVHGPIKKIRAMSVVETINDQ